MADVFFKASVPDELVQKWAQHVRDFDVQNPGCHFEVWVDAPNMSMAQIREALVVNPDLPFKEIFRRGRG